MPVLPVLPLLLPVLPLLLPVLPVQTQTPIATRPHAHGHTQDRQHKGNPAGKEDCSVLFGRSERAQSFTGRAQPRAGRSILRPQRIVTYFWEGQREPSNCCWERDCNPFSLPPTLTQTQTHRRRPPHSPGFAQDSNIVRRTSKLFVYPHPNAIVLRRVQTLGRLVNSSPLKPCSDVMRQIITVVVPKISLRQDHRCGHRRIVQTEVDHRTACQLLILCHFRQFALERERVFQQDPRATWMRPLVCLTLWTSDVAQEQRMIKFFHTWRHARRLSAWKILEWWCRRHHFVTGRQRWCHGCNVSVWHWLKRCFWSPNNWLRSSWQRITGGLSSLRKLVCIGGIRRLCAAWRVT